jgi:dihydroneopterin aldolase
MRAAEAFAPESVKASATARGEAKAARTAPNAAYTVFVRDLEVETCIGAFAHERLKSTVLIMDIEMEVACRAGATDSLSDAVDYGAVVADLRRCLAAKRYYLLEKVCEFAANRILEKFGASRVWVSVAKVGIIEGVGRVGVAVERHAPRGLCPLNPPSRPAPSRPASRGTRD